MFEAKLYIFFIDFRWLEFQNWRATENDHFWNPQLTLRSSRQNLIQFQIIPIFTLSERNAWYKAVSNLNRSSHRLETFIVDCKHSWPSVNNSYSYKQGIILHHRRVVAENLIRKKETASSRLCHSRVMSLLRNHTTFIAKMLLLLMKFCQLV